MVRSIRRHEEWEPFLGKSSHLRVGARALPRCLTIATRTPYNGGMGNSRKGSQEDRIVNSRDDRSIKVTSGSKFYEDHEYRIIIVPVLLFGPLSSAKEKGRCQYGSTQRCHAPVHQAATLPSIPSSLKRHFAQAYVGIGFLLAYVADILDTSNVSHQCN